MRRYRTRLSFVALRLRSTRVPAFQVVIGSDDSSKAAPVTDGPRAAVDPVVFEILEKC